MRIVFVGSFVRKLDVLCGRLTRKQRRVLLLVALLSGREFQHPSRQLAARVSGQPRQPPSPLWDQLSQLVALAARSVPRWGRP